MNEELAKSLSEALNSLAILKEAEIRLMIHQFNRVRDSALESKMTLEELIAELRSDHETIDELKKT